MKTEEYYQNGHFLRLKINLKKENGMKKLLPVSGLITLFFFVFSLFLVIGCSTKQPSMSGIWVSSDDWTGCNMSGNIPGKFKIVQQGDTIITTNLVHNVVIKGTKKGNVVYFKGGTYPIAKDGSDMILQDWQMTLSEDGNAAKETINWTLLKYNCTGVSQISYVRQATD